MPKPLASLRKRLAKGRYATFMKVSFFFLAFLLLLILAETIYILNNKPEYIIGYYLNKAQISAVNSDAQEAINFLVKAAKVNIRYNARQYPQLVPSTYNLNFGLPKSNSRPNQAYLDYIQNLDARMLTRSDEKNLGKTFYSLGLLAYENSQTDFIAPLFQTAVYLNPELSHLHIELANFYLKSGDEEKTKSTLEYCKKFIYSKTHCQQYIDNNLHWRVPEEVGFLEKAVEQHYSST